MKIALIGLVAAGLLAACNTRTAKGTTEEEKADTAATAATSAASRLADGSVEFADDKYISMGRRQLVLFHNGNIDEWGKQFSNDAVYDFSWGDSIVGRQAIIDYWKDRRDNIIETIEFSNDIFLPIKINKPQRGPDRPGIWVLGWYQFEATYKTGQKAGGWIHTDVHYNNQGQVDRVVQYYDRTPIHKATGAAAPKEKAKT